MKYTFLMIALLFSVSLYAQEKFHFSPQEPQAGDLVQFTYQAAGNSSGKAVDAFVMVWDTSGNTTIVDLNTQGRKGLVSGSFRVEEATSLLAFGFEADGIYDDNQQKGFIVPIYKGDNVKKGSQAQIARLYNGLGEYVGLHKDLDKVKAAYEAEFALYPDSRSHHLVPYLSILYREADEMSGYELIQQEIEQIFRKGLRTEQAYEDVIQLYHLLGLSAQSNYLTKQKEAIYKIARLNTDPFFIKAGQTNNPDEKLENYRNAVQFAKNEKAEALLYYFLRSLLNGALDTYAKQSNWEGYHKAVAGVEDPALQAEKYDQGARILLEKKQNAEMAASFAKLASDYAMGELQCPTTDKPALLTGRKWEAQRLDLYARYAETYVHTLYAIKRYDLALNLVKPLTFDFFQQRDIRFNHLYTQLIQEIAKPNVWLPKLEHFVELGAADQYMLDVLRDTYQQYPSKDYLAFMTKIKARSQEYKILELRKKMLHQIAPDFELKDLKGNLVKLSDYKGKTVVIDFWATWCGPCRASFPSMQTLVRQYQKRDDVVFLFINTWETAKEKETAARAAVKDYDFHVLMDNKNEVVSKYPVQGIPTKIIIGKDGYIKFISVGHSQEDGFIDELVEEIEMVREATETILGR